MVEDMVEDMVGDMVEDILEDMVEECSSGCTNIGITSNKLQYEGDRGDKEGNSERV